MCLHSTKLLDLIPSSLLCPQEQLAEKTELFLLLSHEGDFVQGGINTCIVLLAKYACIAVHLYYSGQIDECMHAAGMFVPTRRENWESRVIACWP